MTLIVMREAGERLAIGQLQPALGSFQRLDVWLFIHRQDQRVLWRMQIQPDNVGGLLREAGVGTDTPAAAPLQRDAMLAQHSPNLIRGDVGQRLRQQAAVPAGKPWRHRMIQLRQNASFRLPAIAGGFSATHRISQPIQPMPEKAAAPLAYRGRTRLQGRGNRFVRATGRHTQNQPGAKSIALGAGGPARYSLQMSLLFRCQRNRVRLHGHSIRSTLTYATRY